jgi:phosphatidylserine decarboxylase
LNAALKSTKIEWKPIPIGLGIGFLGLVQFYRVQQREQRRQEEERNGYGSGPDGGKPKKRERIRPSGPW